MEISHLTKEQVDRQDRLTQGQGLAFVLRVARSGLHSGPIGVAEEPPNLAVTTAWYLSFPNFVLTVLVFLAV